MDFAASTQPRPDSADQITISILNFGRWIAVRSSSSPVALPVQSSPAPRSHNTRPIEGRCRGLPGTARRPSPTAPRLSPIQIKQRHRSVCAGASAWSKKWHDNFTCCEGRAQHYTVLASATRYDDNYSSGPSARIGSHPPDTAMALRRRRACLRHGLGRRSDAFDRIRTVHHRMAACDGYRAATERRAMACRI